MTKKLNPEEIELYKKIAEVLFNMWDPIGISHEVDVNDEYNEYVPKVFNLLIANEPKEFLIKYLSDVEFNRMGLTPDIRRIQLVVDVLLVHKKKILGFQ